MFWPHWALYVLKSSRTLCPCVLSFLLALWSPRLGKRELVCVLLVHLFVLYVLVWVIFLFLLVSGVGCDFWLWLSLDLFFFRFWPQLAQQVLTVEYIWKLARKSWGFSKSSVLEKLLVASCCMAYSKDALVPFICCKASLVPSVLLQRISFLQPSSKDSLLHGILPATHS